MYISFINNVSIEWRMGEGTHPNYYPVMVRLSLALNIKHLKTALIQYLYNKSKSISNYNWSERSMHTLDTLHGAAY
jgi:hypothetical protein